MHDFLVIASLILGLNLLLSLVAMLRKTNTSDRVLGVQLLGTNGVGLLLLMSLLQDQSGLIDAALVLALLAAVVVIAFTRREQEQVND